MSAGMLVASLLAVTPGLVGEAAAVGSCTSGSSSAAWAWGIDAAGQLGDGMTTDHGTPQQVFGLGPGSAVSLVAAGQGHSLAVANGRLWAWGDNSGGQLGDGTTQTSSSPVLVSLSGTPSAVAAGPDFSLAVVDGSVWAWGADSAGQLGSGASAGPARSTTPVVVAGLPGGVTAVAAGDGFGLALAGGVVWAWGRNDLGQLGNGQSADAGGTSAQFQAVPKQVANLGQVSALSARQGFSLALRSDGTVWGWGNNTFGALGGGGGTGANPTAVQVGGLPGGVTSVAAGDTFSLALADGVVWGWGLGKLLGDPSLGSRVVLDPMRVPNVDHVGSIAAGSSHGVAVKDDGSVVWEWGLPWGQSNPAYVAPTAVAGLDHVAGIAAGWFHTLAIRHLNEAFLSPCAGTTPQTTAVGTAFPSPLAVQVKDMTGAPVGSGVTVIYTVQPSISGASGSFGAAPGPVEVSTDANGVATASFQANGISGTYSVTASRSGYQPAVLILMNTRPPASLTTILGDSQQTRVLADFATALQVQVNDSSGKPVSAPVTFAVQPSNIGAGATFPDAVTSATVAVGQDGRATAPTLTANVTPGTFTVTATIVGTAITASFSLTSFTPLPASLQVVYGDNQSATIGSDRFGSNLSVKVVDSHNGPASGASVTFRVVPSSAGAGATLNGKAGSTTVTTGGDGTATVASAPNAVVGSYIVQAAVVGVANPAVFHLSNTQPGKPVVTRVDPSAGFAWGGTEVAIQGSGFGGPLPVTTVRFGAVAVAVEPGGTDNVIHAVAPPGTVDQSVAVTVARADPALPASDQAGPSDTFTWFAGSWHPVGTLNQPRFGHSATVLDAPSCHPASGSPPGWCGSVVLVGGQSDGRTPCAANGPSVLASAEVYDPIGKVFDDIAPMHLGRTDHSATLLADGRVLVVGGCGADHVLGSAEIFDPTTGWIPAAPLQGPRMNHTATLLADGRVLVAGGAGVDGSALGSAEIFDPNAMSPGRTLPDAGISKGGAPSSMDPAIVTSPTANFTSGDVGRVVTSAARRTDGSLVVPPGAVVAEVNGPRVITLSVPATSAAGGVSITLGPLTGSWTATARMAEARRGHTATLLPSGRVLVAGGVGPGGLGKSSYELYDPGSGTWSKPDNTMRAGRWGHTATLIAGGKVLVTGGCCTTTGNAEALVSAEVYDPGTNGGAGGWRSTGAMASARQGHTASLVDDGTVLVAGGTDDPSTTGQATASTERYDPKSGTWLDQGQLLHARAGHSASALGSGRVVVAGGIEAGGTTLASVEVFDPTAGQPTPVVTTVNPAAAAAGTDVTINGTGFYSQATVVTFGTTVAAAPIVVSDHKIVVAAPAQARGTVEVVVTRPDAMGNSVASPISPAARFTYPPGGWTAAAALDSCTPNDLGCVPRTRHTATALDAPACHQPNPPSWCGLVLLAGGETPAPGGLPAAVLPTNAAELYNPALGAWTPTAPMNVARMDHTATLLSDGRVLVVGGQRADGGSGLASAEVFDPVHGTWTQVPGGLHNGRFDHTATLLHDGMVLVVGGADQASRLPLDTAELYDPARNLFTLTGPPDGCSPDPACLPRVGHSATALADGTVLVVGGLTLQAGLPTPSYSAQLYDPATGAWKAADSLLPGEQRAYHTATLLGDGRVLVAGGYGGLDAANTIDLVASTWLYDATAQAGARWRAAQTMATGRAAHSATLLADGTVLVAGGGAPLPADTHTAGNARILSVPPRAAAEIFDPSAGSNGTWSSTTSMAVARGGHTATVLDAPSCHAPVAPPSSPPSWCGAVLVAGGTPDDSYVDSGASAELYTPAPSLRAIIPPVGVPSGGTKVTVDGFGFSGATTVSFGSDKAEIVSQTATEIIVRSPRHAAGPVTVSVTAGAGSSLTVAPNPAAVFTYGYGACPTGVNAGPGEIRFGAGYSLIGLPANTNVRSDSPLYGWWDTGSGTTYQTLEPDTIAPGHAYFAWLACPQAVSVGSTAAAHLRFPLGGYHASIVGNPTSGRVTVSGFDYAARWDPNLNGGTGGYHLSGYRQVQPLAPGEGIWVFSYQPSTIAIDS